MCTAISINEKDSYFGRNLDFEHGFGEKIIITPRNFPLSFKNGKEIKNHFAIIGMGIIEDGFPLYFDASNEKGLSIAGLNFPVSCEYKDYNGNEDNVASFEFVLWILAECENVDSAKILLRKTNITKEQLNDNLPCSPLHFFIADKEKAITVEQTKKGLNVYENPVGVLTNEPEFPVQLYSLSSLMHVSNEEPKNRFSHKINLEPDSRGMGALGLPGDLSSASRFQKASFVKLNALFGESEKEIVNRFFYILYSVSQIEGCVKVKDGFEQTRYTSCINQSKGIYYYTTFQNSDINGVDMHRENLDSDNIKTFELIKNSRFKLQN